MITALAAIFVLGILVFFHELGHFLVAKKVGIRVDKFSLGFPPTIISRKYGETEYCLSAIPLGGYVKMAGENPDEDSTGAPDEFMSKSMTARAAVVLAGPVMNFVLAWLVLWGLFYFNGEATVDPSRAVIGEVSPGTPAEQAGLQPGDIITSLNGAVIGPFADLSRITAQTVEQPLTIVWFRGGQEMTATVTTISEETLDDTGKKITKGILGVRPQVEYKQWSLLGAAGRALTEAVDFVRKMVLFVRDLISFKISPKLIGGPVFIVQVAGQTAEMGWSALLYFMAFLSVNLTVINLLPIPILDGGHLVFLAIEKIKGSPMSINQRTVALKIGLVFLLLVIVMVTYNDIMRFITG